MPNKTLFFGSINQPTITNPTKQTNHPTKRLHYFFKNNLSLVLRASLGSESTAAIGAAAQPPIISDKPPLASCRADGVLLLCLKKKNVGLQVQNLLKPEVIRLTILGMSSYGLQRNPPKLLDAHSLALRMIPTAFGTMWSKQALKRDANDLKTSKSFKIIGFILQQSSNKMGQAWAENSQTAPTWLLETDSCIFAHKASKISKCILTSMSSALPKSAILASLHQESFLFQERNIEILWFSKKTIPKVLASQPISVRSCPWCILHETGRSFQHRSIKPGWQVTWETRPPLGESKGAASCLLWDKSGCAYCCRMLPLFVPFWSNKGLLIALLSTFVQSQLVVCSESNNW